MMIKDFGGQIASVWEGLRPMTRNMLVGALQTSGTSSPHTKTPKFSYDAHADWELSRLLFALDERTRSSEAQSDSETLDEMNKLADTCRSCPGNPVRFG